jgi:hypothetical protein
MYSYVLVCTRMYLCFTRMLLVCTRVLLVCTRMLFVCYSYVLVCYSYVLVCTCVLLVCYSYVLVWCFSHDRKIADKYRSTIYRFIRFRCNRPFKSHGTSVTQAHHGWHAQNIRRFQSLSSGLSMIICTV